MVFDQRVYYTYALFKQQRTHNYMLVNTTQMHLAIMIVSIAFYCCSCDACHVGNTALCLCMQDQWHG